jgi:hypothetical protein
MPNLTCQDFAPALICGYSDLMLYLAPSIVMAIIFHRLAQRSSVFLLFYLSGTLLHEIAHLVAGALTRARPSSFSIIPRRQGDQWILGSVGFNNIRWWNAVFVGLAPLLTVTVPILVAYWRTRAGLTFEWLDAGLAALLAPVFLCFLPSRADLRIALYSWPYLVPVGLYIGFLN